MDGVGENLRIIAKNGCGAVPLVGVRIDYHDPDSGALVLEIAYCDGDVVEDAVALAVLAERVVGAAGEADADSFLKRGVAGKAGGLDFGGGAREEVGRGGQSEQELLLPVEGGGLDLLDVSAVVDAEDVVEIGGLDLGDFLGAEDVFLEKHLLGNTEFVHRKRVAGGQIELESL